MQGSEPLEQKYRAGLAWKYPAGLVTTDPLPGSILVTLSGSRSAVRRADDADLTIAIDLTESSPGEAGLEFSTFPVSGLPPNVEVTGWAPSAIRFVLDESDTRKVRVKPEIVGDPGAGYAVGTVSIDPKVVAITGPRGVVEDLKVVNTKPIDVSDLTASAMIDAELALPRSVDLAEGVAAPKAKVQIQPLLDHKEIASVPVVVPRHNDWVPTTETVTVVLEGPAATLQWLTGNDLMAVVHLPDEPKKPRYEASYGPSEGLRIEIRHSEGDTVKVVACNPPSVEVRRR